MKTGMTKFMERNMGILYSLKGKLLLMCTASLFIIIFLGITTGRMVVQNKNDFNLAANIYEVNDLNQKSRTINTEYLYSLDTKLLNEIKENMTKSVDIVKNTVTDKRDVKKMETLLTESSSNMDSMMELVKERGFQAGEGLFDKFAEDRFNLTSEYQTLNTIQSWDGLTMDDYSMYKSTKVIVDGKSYLKVNYQADIPDFGQRLKVGTRVGGSGISLKGKVYITDVKFSNGQDLEVVDISKNQDEVKNNASGAALVSAEVTEFNGQPAISVEAKFDKNSDSWQEASIPLLVDHIDQKNFNKVSYVAYFDASTPRLNLGVAMDQRYNFMGAINSLNTYFDEYNKAIAEGNKETTQEKYDAITSLLDEMQKKIEVSFPTGTAIDAAKGLIVSCKTQIVSMNKFDQQILEYKLANKDKEKELLTLSSGIQEDITKGMNRRNESTNVILVGITLLSILLIGGLSYLIINSIQRNMVQFREVVKEVSSGNLKVRANTQTNDEFAVFSEDLNNFLEQLSSALSSVQELAGDVNVKNQIIANVIKIAVNGSKIGGESEQEGILQLQEKFNEVGINIMNQSVSTEECLASLYEIIENNQNSVEVMTYTEDISKNSMDKAKEGTDKIAVLTQKMDKIILSVDRASQDIENLVSDANQMQENLKSGGMDNQMELMNRINHRIEQVKNATAEVIFSLRDTYKITSNFTEVIRNMNDSATYNAECINSLMKQIQVQMESMEQIVKAVDQINIEAQEIQEKTVDTFKIADKVSEKLVANLSNVDDLVSAAQKMNDDIKFFQV